MRIFKQLNHVKVVYFERAVGPTRSLADSPLLSTPSAPSSGTLKACSASVSINKAKEACLYPRFFIYHVVVRASDLPIGQQMFNDAVGRYTLFGQLSCFQASSSRRARTKKQTGLSFFAYFRRPFTDSTVWKIIWLLWEPTDPVRQSGARSKINTTVKITIIILNNNAISSDVTLKAFANCSYL